MTEKLRMWFLMPHGWMIGLILTQKNAMLLMENGYLTIQLSLYTQIKVVHT
jgi:hypothetical protein